MKILQVLVQNFGVLCARAEDWIQDGSREKIYSDWQDRANYETCLDLHLGKGIIPSGSIQYFCVPI